MKLNIYVKTADDGLFTEAARVAHERGQSLSTLIADAVKAHIGRPDPLADLTQRLERIEDRLTPTAYVDDDHPVAKAIRDLDAGRVADLRTGRRSPHAAA